MKTLAVVPARAGSKGIPGKNKRVFCGKPLVSWAIECGQRTCSAVAVTTDDPDVIDIADQYGLEPIVRPEDLAQDDTPMLDVLRHVLACYEPRLPEVVVLLQPTQPLRTDEQILRALSLLSQRKTADSVVSVVQVPPHMCPDYAVRIEANQLRLQTNAVRRQDCRPAYYRDGTVYAMRSELLARGAMYGRSLPMVLDADESVTIDTERDWRRAESLWRRRHES